MPIFSLPNEYGIGTFGKTAYKWVDFLVKSGQKYWQVLPLGPTSYGDSPYQSFSAFAGNPYFIDPDMLADENLLTDLECEKYSCKTSAEIDYALLYINRFKLLRIAFSRFNDFDKLEEFKKQQSFWLDDYTLFMALKSDNNQKEWSLWNENLRLHNKQAINTAKEFLKDEVNFHAFLQYMFFNQWNKLKLYANKKGISIIGDMPIYVALDSADVWANKQFFQLDKNGIPTEVAGCPPDSFSEEGQLWGNPLYNWNVLKADNFKWWQVRMKSSLELFDIVRIDHFRGLESYYAIPFGDKNAKNGEWRKGPDADFIYMLKENFPENAIIAEDLGFLTKAVRKLLELSGYPGMKVLQFAFDSDSDCEYLPHNFNNNCVVYTGTHDNNTTLGWIEDCTEESLDFARKYLDIHYHPNEQWCFIRRAMSSVANLAVIPIQDYLGLGSAARINTPSTLGGNWVWQADEDFFDEVLAEKIFDVTKIYGRI